MDGTSDPLRDYHNYLRNVGDIATQYASFEYVLHECIWKLAGVDEIKGGCITAEIMSIAPKFRILMSLIIENKCPEQIQKLAKEIEKEAAKISNYRNKYIHSPMATEIIDGKLIPNTQISRNDKGYNNEIEPYNFNDMQKTSMNIQDLKNKTKQLRDSIRKHLNLPS